MTKPILEITYDILSKELEMSKDTLYKAVSRGDFDPTNLLSIAYYVVYKDSCKKSKQKPDNMSEPDEKSASYKMTDDKSEYIPDDFWKVDKPARPVNPYPEIISDYDSRRGCQFKCDRNSLPTRVLDEIEAYAKECSKL